MTVRELIEALNQYDGDLGVDLNVVYEGVDRIALVEVGDSDQIMAVTTFVVTADPEHYWAKRDAA